MRKLLQSLALVAGLLGASFACAYVHAQTAQQPGPAGLVPLNLNMEKLQLDQLKCKALEAEANFHAFNAVQIGKERDALQAKVKELEGKIAELEAAQQPKENPPAVDVLKGNPP